MRQPVNQKPKQMSYKWSILIATLKSRSPHLSRITDDLFFQIQTLPIEVLWLGDNKSRKVGAKRNILKDLAQGEWISYVDDDDVLEENYIQKIYRAILDHPEKSVITFKGELTTDGREDTPFRYSHSYGFDHKRPMEDGRRWTCRTPDHLCVWKKSIIKEDFPDKQLGEDRKWAQDMRKHYTENDELFIDETLYFYNFRHDTTECRIR